MKIDFNNGYMRVNALKRTYRSDNTAATGNNINNEPKNSDSMSADVISISPDAACRHEIDTTVKKITSEIVNSSQADDDRIESLRTQIQNGTYNISAGDVANAVLNRML